MSSKSKAPKRWWMFYVSDSYNKRLLNCEITFEDYKKDSQYMSKKIDAVMNDKEEITFEELIERIDKTIDKMLP